MPRDPRDVLGVGPLATPEEIRQAFRALAAKFHPDRNPGNAEAERRFREISWAYAELAGPDAGTRGPSPQGAGGRWASPDSTSTSFDFIGSFLGDVFGSIFGAPAGGPQRRTKGDDVRIDVDVGAHEAFLGAERPVSYVRKARCTNCGGEGSATRGAMAGCRPCASSGRISISAAIFVVGMSCPECGGRGTIPEAPCPICAGTGLRKAKTDIKIVLPGALRDGSRLRFSGMGNESAATGADAGDLLVDVHVRH